MLVKVTKTIILNLAGYTSQKTREKKSCNLTSTAAASALPQVHYCLQKHLYSDIKGSFFH